jgi:hypothetical protein
MAVRRVALGALMVSVVAVPVGGTPAAAQQEELRIRGTVTGELVRGSRVTFQITASHPEGFRALKAVTIVADLRGVALEELAYEVDESAISSEGGKALVGTGNTITGRFFSVDAIGIRVSTGGDTLTVSIPMMLRENLPQGTRFRFVAEDDFGEEAEVAVRARVEEEEEGLSVATVVAAIVLALLAGGFLGSRLTSHRRPTGSIYGTVARRLQEEREGRAGRPAR